MLDRNTQHVMDVYTENCDVCIKIAVLAIIAFAIVGRKTAIFQQYNGLLPPNLQQRRRRIYTYMQNPAYPQKIFLLTLPPFYVDGHVYSWNSILLLIVKARSRL